MTRIVALFYLAIALWLGGFLAAGVTAGAPGAVATGAFGLLATLVTGAIRIGPQPSQ